MLRGTIKQHVALMGYADSYSTQYEPIIAAGYGLVVGLDGTGSSEIPPQVRAHMVADLAKRGLGESTRGWGHIKPDALLNSNETAVVIVEAAIPQAASGRKPSRSNMREDHPSLRGTVFDVHVYAEPSSSTTSLEGGMLLPTLLRQGELTTGRSQAREVAAASGPVFINPFAEPNAINSDSVHRTSGRILKGGEVLHNMTMRLVLFEPSHARASLIQSSINRIFPEELGQDGPTAHGMSSEMIDIRVPPSWKDDVPTFMEIMTHITMRSQNPEGIAMSVKRLLIADPSPRNADAAAWRWRAIGPRVLSVIRPLYEHTESLPRIAALRAGGGLEDPLVIPFLLEEATSKTALGSRLDAIELLESMPVDYRIEEGIRPLLNDTDLEIRLRVAEALVKRNDTSIKKYSIPDKFDLIHVPSDYNMIYVTQTGYPKIILAGDIEISRPLTLQAWDNNLLIKDADDDSGELLVRYQDTDKGTTTLQHITADLPTFTMFLAHESTPEEPAPGLDLSYSRTIGALHTIWRQKYIDADFKVEQDRLLAAIKRLTTESSFVPRPDFEPETEKDEAPRFIEQPQISPDEEVPLS
jgi:flagellar basal body P-ring protein FlgI